jgi:hypothetical protein
MPITQAMCTSFKAELMQALHNFTVSTGNAFKIALYTSSATLGATTTAYTTSNEVAAGGGYTAGGNPLTNVTPTTGGTTGFTDFADTTWAVSTITARGALVYNSTNSNRSVIVLDFGSDKTSTAGDFTISFPLANSTDAIIRIA